MLKLCNLIKANVWYLQSLEKLAIEIWFPFNFAKYLKGRHFVVGGSKNLKLSTSTCFSVSFQKNVLLSFLLFSSVFYQDALRDSKRNEIASSAARQFKHFAKFYVPSTTLQVLSTMILKNFVAFVVFKILLNLVSMQNLLNANNCWHKQNLENCLTWPHI